MGYYSEVAIAIKENEYKNMLKTLEESEKYKNKEYIKNFVETASQDVPDCYRDEEYIFLHWESYKWYEEFEEVKFVMEYLKTIKDEDYDYIKIGEDYDDVDETLNTGLGLVRLVRTIEFN